MAAGAIPGGERLLHNPHINNDIRSDLRPGPNRVKLILKVTVLFAAIVALNILTFGGGGAALGGIALGIHLAPAAAKTALVVGKVIGKALTVAIDLYAIYDFFKSTGEMTAHSAVSSYVIENGHPDRIRRMNMSELKHWVHFYIESSPRCEPDLVAQRLHTRTQSRAADVLTTLRELERGGSILQISGYYTAVMNQL